MGGLHGTAAEGHADSSSGTGPLLELGGVGEDGEVDTLYRCHILLRGGVHLHVAAAPLYRLHVLLRTSGYPASPPSSSTAAAVFFCMLVDIPKSPPPSIGSCEAIANAVVINDETYVSLSFSFN